MLELKKNHASWAMNTSFILLGFLGLSYAAIFTVLLIRLPLNVGSLSLVYIVYAAIISLWVIKKYPYIWKLNRYAALLASSLIIISFVVSGLVYDTSFDGQGYHQMAIDSIKAGWNPLYSPTYVLSLWVMYYPKALWMLGANFYTMTGHVETGKAVNLISWFASFFAVFAVLSKLFAARMASVAQSISRPQRFFYAIAPIIIAVCAACNPVTIVQLFTFYNDGIIGSLLLTLISALIYHAISFDKPSLLSAAICVIILVNIKFTALAYGGLICAFYLVYILYKKRMTFKKGFIYLACAGLIGILIFGYNPYIVNTLTHGHPLYPLAGKGKVDIITLNSPANFIGANKLQAFLLSNTATTHDSITPEESHPAQLWPVKWEDFKYINNDTRTGGFGPLTYWILISSLALWMFTLTIHWRTGIVASLITAGIMATVFINPAPWWARYVPQVWLVPLALVALGFMTRSYIIRAASCLVLIIVLINAVQTVRIVSGIKINQSNEVHAQYEQLKNKHIQIFTNATASVLPHLQEHGVPYTEVKKEELSCKNPTKLLYAIDAEYCE